MSLTWNGAEPPDLPRPTLWQRLVGGLRALILVLATYGGMVFVLVFNWVERRWALGVSIRIIQGWARLCLWLCGVRLEVRGVPLDGGGALVANHTGWIDIFAILAAHRVYFVSKADVARWPVVGPLSRQIGTVYVERRRSDAKAQGSVVRARLAAGDRLAFFPEATSTDGQRVLGFKSTLFQPLHADPETWVQPVSVTYHPRPGLPAAFYGWWGTMGLGGHLAAVFQLSYGGVARVCFHPPRRAGAFPDRKALALWAEGAVRDGVATALELDLELDPAPGSASASPGEGHAL